MISRLINNFFLLKACNFKNEYLIGKNNPASKVVQIRAALMPVPSPDKWGGLQQGASGVKHIQIFVNARCKI